jgi:hypothetical protein
MGLIFNGPNRKSLEIAARQLVFMVSEGRFSGLRRHYAP